MIKPVRDHILIEVEIPEMETTRSSGIIVKSQAIPRQTIGKVLEVGEGRTLENGTLVPCVTKPGDNIIFYDYAGVAVHPKKQQANKSYLIIKQNDVIAIVSNEGDAGGLI